MMKGIRLFNLERKRTASFSIIDTLDIYGWESADDKN